MTLDERLTEAHRRSVSLYLRRQNLESQRQQIVQMAQSCDVELIKSDGEIAVLTELVAEAAAKVEP